MNKLCFYINGMGKVDKSVVRYNHDSQRFYPPHTIKYLRPKHNLYMAAYSVIPRGLTKASNDHRGSSAPCDLELLRRYGSKGPHANSWGVTIFRTIYTPESDTIFPIIVERINGFMTGYFPSAGQKPIEADREIISRHINTVIEGRATLDNASIEQVHAAFEKWVEPEGLSNSNNTRYRIALMIDQAALDGIMKLPLPGDHMAPIDATCACPCKAVSRWGIDRAQSVPWFYVCLADFTMLWFWLLEEELIGFVHRVQENPLEYEHSTALSMMKRMGTWPLPDPNGPGFGDRFKPK